MRADPLRIAVLVSGEGTTMAALAQAITRGTLPARIVLVAADRPHIHALDRARELGLPTQVFSPREGPTGAWQQKLVDALVKERTELVVLAGFLRVLDRPFFEQFTGRIVNTHPSLLPKFGGVGMYGPRVHAAVLASGDRVTGATVHLVTPDVDRGPILAQEEHPIVPGESAEALSERQKPLEHRLLIEVVRRFSTGELSLPYLVRGPSV
ncbi:MAG: phosphoribosylglycinamide formyltransferase [Euryarchaeota archaeon]|nr:phosphoribosylglycinamide formyltransferase [Euryarchaeota archaeon]MDE2046598.1 phosphoribosylglycinamide formyltransferase [Thermoplasmata archaeon]